MTARMAQAGRQAVVSRQAGRQAVVSRQAGRQAGGSAVCVFDERAGGKSHTHNHVGWRDHNMSPQKCYAPINAIDCGW